MLKPPSWGHTLAKVNINSRNSPIDSKKKQMNAKVRILLSADADLAKSLLFQADSNSY